MAAKTSAKAKKPTAPPIVWIGIDDAGRPTPDTAFSSKKDAQDYIRDEDMVEHCGPIKIVKYGPIDE